MDVGDVIRPVCMREDECMSEIGWITAKPNSERTVLEAKMTKRKGGKEMDHRGESKIDTIRDIQFC